MPIQLGVGYLAGPVSSDITNATFSNNRAIGQGGAITVDGEWSPRVSKSIFTNNTAGNTTIESGNFGKERCGPPNQECDTPHALSCGLITSREL